MQRRRLGATVDNADLDEQVIGRLLGVLDEHVEVAILVEDTGVEQLILWLAAAASAIRRDKVGIGKWGLGILIEVLHVGMGGSAIQVEVILFDVLSVITL